MLLLYSLCPPCVGHPLHARLLHQHSPPPLRSSRGTCGWKCRSGCYYRFLRSGLDDTADVAGPWPCVVRILAHGPQAMLAASDAGEGACWSGAGKCDRLWVSSTTLRELSCSRRVDAWTKVLLLLLLLYQFPLRNTS